MVGLPSLVSEFSKICFCASNFVELKPTDVCCRQWFYLSLERLTLSWVIRGRIAWRMDLSTKRQINGRIDPSLILIEKLCAWSGSVFSLQQHCSPSVFDEVL